MHIASTQQDTLSLCMQPCQSQTCQTGGSFCMLASCMQPGSGERVPLKHVICCLCGGNGLLLPHYGTWLQCGYGLCLACCCVLCASLSSTHSACAHRRWPDPLNCRLTCATPTSPSDACLDAFLTAAARPFRRRASIAADMSQLEAARQDCNTTEMIMVRPCQRDSAATGVLIRCAQCASGEPDGVGQVI